MGNNDIIDLDTNSILSVTRRQVTNDTDKLKNSLQRTFMYLIMIRSTSLRSKVYTSETQRYRRGARVEIPISSHRHGNQEVQPEVLLEAEGETGTKEKMVKLYLIPEAHNDHDRDREQCGYAEILFIDSQDPDDLEKFHGHAYDTKPFSRVVLTAVETGHEKDFVPFINAYPESGGITNEYSEITLKDAMKDKWILLWRRDCTVCDGDDIIVYILLDRKRNNF